MPSQADSYLDSVAAPEEDRLWGVAVTLKRGTLTTTGVTAQKFSGEKKVNLDDGNYVQFFEGTWVISKARYKFSGVAAKPKRGDRIVEADGTEWELVPIEDQSEARELQGGLEWELQTKRVKEV